MEFACEQDELIRGIATVERAIGTRESNPVLEGIYVKAEGDRLQLIATDLELSIDCYVNAQVTQPGAAVLNGRVFGQIIRKLGADQLTYKTEQKGVARIEAGRSRFSVHTMAHDEFPPVSTGDNEPMLSLSQRDLRRMIRKTTFATATDDSRPFLTGVLVEVEGNQLRLVATDSSRLAFHEGELLQAASADISTILPVRTLTEVMRLLTDDEETVHFSLKPTQTVFQLPGVQVVSRVIEGQFPDYGRALQGVQESKFVVDRQQLLAAVERVALVGRRSAPVVRLQLQGNVLTLTSREAEVGEAFEELEVNSEGVDGQSSYQARFLTEVLRALESEKVQVELGEGLRQGRILGLDEQHYTYIVMPVRVG